MQCGNLFFCIGTLLSNYINVLYKICYSMRIYNTSLHAICLILCSGYHSCPWAITYTYMFVRNVNCDGRKWAGYAMGGCSCALSCLHMNMPRSGLIPKRLARRRLFCALPAEYPANAEVEARECASADNLYDEQQPSARCGDEQLLGKGRVPAASRHATLHLVPDCLQKNSHNAEDIIPDRVAQLQSLHTCLSAY